MKDGDKILYLFLLCFLLFWFLQLLPMVTKSGQEVLVERTEMSKPTTSKIIVGEKSSSLRATTPGFAGTNVSEKEVGESAQVFTNHVVSNNNSYYKVVKIIDGDTIDILFEGEIKRLRLIGINTPEIVDSRKKAECFGREASDYAHKLLDGQEVNIEADSSQDNQDKYGRLLRYVWRRDGLFYNLEAIKNGYAYEYTFIRPYKYQADFKSAQKFSEANKLGLWADSACLVKNVAVPKVVNTLKTDCLIKGNIGSTGDKIYHLPTCPYYKQTVINESQGERWFCTEEQAVGAGWRKAGNCP